VRVNFSRWRARVAGRRRASARAREVSRVDGGTTMGLRPRARPWGDLVGGVDDEDDERDDEKRARG